MARWWTYRLLGSSKRPSRGVGVEDVPDAVADLLESDVLSVESPRKELLLGVKPEGFGIAD
jgi:hypothetical protein